MVLLLSYPLYDLLTPKIYLATPWWLLTPILGTTGLKQGTCYNGATHWPVEADSEMHCF